MKNSFIRGAVILMLASGINRVVGFVYQAILYRLVGPEGVGLFNLVYPVYILIIVLATAGIPLGISKLVSEEDAKGNTYESYQIFWLCAAILTVSGLAMALFSYIIAPLLLKYVFVNKSVYNIFLVLIPGIFIISVSSALRGFFQGMMNMTPPALGQIMEQLVRVAVGISLAVRLLPYGIQWAAVGMAAAGVVGELAGLVVMAAIYRRHKPGQFKFCLPGKNASLHILRKLFDLCAPITVGRVAATVMLSIDSVLLPAMLKKAGYTTSDVTILYGQLTGVALTLLFIPSIITVSLATSLVPAISEAVATDRWAVVAHRTREAVRVAFLAGIPFTTAFLLLPGEITQAVFGSAEAGGILAVLAVGGLLAYLQQTTTGILQGLGRPAVPLKNMLAAGALKVALILWMASAPGFSITHCAWAYNFFFTAAALLNLRSLKQEVRFRVYIADDIVKPLAAGAAAGLVEQKIYSWASLSTGSSRSVTLALLSGFLVYLISLYWLGAVKKSELARVPLFHNIFFRRP